MKIEFKKSFLKDLQHIQNRKLKNSILDVIQQVEQADQLNEIKNLKRLKDLTVITGSVSAIIG